MGTSPDELEAGHRSSGPAIPASRDPRTGQWFVPPRLYAVDGSLTELHSGEIGGTGVLTEVVQMGGGHFGYVDLPGQVRLMATIDDVSPRVGGTYEASTSIDGKRVFRHVE